MRGQEEGTRLDGPWSAVTREVVTRWRQRSGRAVAVFDADGTLWGDDLGERHLRVLEARELVSPSPGYESVIEEYEARCREDTDAGYSWAVTCMEGLHEGDAVGTAVLAWAAHRHLVPHAIRDLFAWLGELEIEVWLVSASNRWAIETAAAELGVPPERVIAMSMDVVEGQLRGAAHRPLCNGAGKTALIEKRIGSVPLRAVGNSRHDMAMLKQAELGAVVRLSGVDCRLPAACPELSAAAQAEGWFELDLRWDEDPA